MQRTIKIIPILIMVAILFGCATESAVQQLAKQTQDPGILALGAFADAQDAYVGALQLYRPYQKVLQRVNPDLDSKIIRLFQDANKILDKWELALTSMPLGDQAAFREYIRQITLELALLAAGE